MKKCLVRCVMFALVAVIGLGAASFLISSEAHATEKKYENDLMIQFEPEDQQKERRNNQRVAQPSLFVKPTFENILETMIRFRAVDYNDDALVDMYARTRNCSLYLKSYDNEFEWEKVRNEIRKTLEEKAHSLPVGYTYDTTMQLDRYDFRRGIYPFHGKGRSLEANTFSIDLQKEAECGREKSRPYPTKIKFLLAEPLSLVGLELSEKEGRLLFERMEKLGNRDHLIFPRFKFRVRFVATLIPRKKIMEEMREMKWKGMLLGDISVAQSVEDSTAIIDVDLDSIDYYEDKARTRLIYTYYP
ncbi:MAG: DUF4852 domain-containing protein [Proteobacteria bacterium]|nr:DUF4852 domain-containing protein [Alphaproteobacteria bacterium]NCC03716.1 DUF4852 domain-containing protein [Pseudomonadota bacterium]